MLGEYSSGLYKIKWLQRFQLMKIFVKDNQRFIRVGAGIAEPEYVFAAKITPDDDFQIISKLQADDPFQHIRISVTFQDMEGDAYELSARNLYILKRILNEYPALLDGFRR